MKRERTPLLQDRQRFSAIRPSALIRATAVRAALIATIRAAIDAKPQGHDFHIGRGLRPAVARHMSTTGG